ncbi:MAG: NADP-dependent oxidoreductase [Dehalococcoidia bacterium]|nr:NADP-dependent oxidoreductase [Dehalococcoidia bacterium]
MADMNRAWTMASRPEGEPVAENFILVESPVPEAKHGEVLVRTLYMSLDPYMRGRMRSGPSYATPLQPDDVMTGEVVARVEQSQSPIHSVGDIVRASIGWQEWAAVPAHTATAVDPSLGPVSTAVGVLGMPGMTAYFGLLEVLKPRAGDTLVVSAASGAVGAVVGQVGKLNGCFVIGVAGSDEKCSYVVNELGFDGAINYKTQDVSAEIARLSPTGVDVYFDNVGGPVSDAVFENLALKSRVAVCGQISQYNAATPALGPRVLGNLIRTRTTVEGFLVYDFVLQHEIARARIAKWIREGRLKYKEDIVDGFENAPSAFIGLLRGENFGKLLVRVSDRV